MIKNTKSFCKNFFTLNQTRPKQHNVVLQYNSSRPGACPPQAMSGVIIDCDCGLHRFDLVFMLALMMQIESTVGEVMSSPAITLTPDKTVLGNLLTIGTHESL